MSAENKAKLRIGVIHAAPGAIRPLNDAVHKLLPDAEITSFLNEEMLQYVNRKGTVDSKAMRMFACQVFQAAEADPDIIVIACNVFAAHAEKLLPFVSVPLLSADSSMQKKAVETGGRIGVIGTNRNAVPACSSGIRRTAEKCGLPVPELIDGTVTEAAKALADGNSELADRLITDKVRELIEQDCNAIILSQITLARTKDALLRAGINAPILTTPDECAEAVAAAAADLRK